MFCVLRSDGGNSAEQEPEVEGDFFGTRTCPEVGEGTEYPGHTGHSVQTNSLVPASTGAGDESGQNIQQMIEEMEAGKIGQKIADEVREHGMEYQVLYYLCNALICRLIYNLLKLSIVE